MTYNPEDDNVAVPNNSVESNKANMILSPSSSVASS